MVNWTEDAPGVDVDVTPRTPQEWAYTIGGCVLVGIMFGVIVFAAVALGVLP